MRLLAFIFFASALLGRGAESAAGRWEGPAQIPGRELKLVVDLSEEAGKGWIGSIIIRGRHLLDSSWREAPTVSTDRQFSIGAIFSTPLVAKGVVYFGSTDGNLYAIE